MDQFRGFSVEGIAFLRGLQQNNTKSYFSDHSAEYQRFVLEPTKGFVDAVGSEIQRQFGRKIQFEARTGRSMFRINRDLRFSKDKTPFNPWVDLVFWEGGDSARVSPSFIFRLAHDHLVLGAGVFSMSNPTLGHFRSAVLDESRGTQLAMILENLAEEKQDVEVSRPTRKQVPRGFPADHPRSDLLKLERLQASFSCPHPSMIDRREFVDWCVKEFAAFAPLHRWLVDNLGIDGTDSPVSTDNLESPPSGSPGR